MKITADTNILVRAIMADDAVQSPLAISVLANAENVVIPLHVLCEVAWVLSQSYKIKAADIRGAIARLCDAENVSVDRPLLAAGLAMLDAGGDFGDGVIAHDGRTLGAEVFVSFDAKAVKLLMAQGVKALVPA